MSAGEGSDPPLPGFQNPLIPHMYPAGEVLGGVTGRRMADLRYRGWETGATNLKEYHPLAAPIL